MRRQLTILSCIAVGLLVVLTPLAGQEEAAAPALVLEEILVDPESPGVDTLCKLRVRIRNDGSKTASQFGFTVKINGQELPVYGNQLFMYPVEAGSSLEFPLYNFWTTETAREAPADGKLRLEISIDEAEWMKIETIDEVETWTPLGPVEGLPAAAAKTLTMQ